MTVLAEETGNTTTWTYGVAVERAVAHKTGVDAGIGDDVVSTLLDLHRRREENPFERVVIETSGLADPVRSWRRWSRLRS